MEREITAVDRTKALGQTEQVPEPQAVQPWETAIKELREMLRGGPSLEDMLYEMRRSEKDKW